MLRNAITALGLVAATGAWAGDGTSVQSISPTTGCNPVTLAGCATIMGAVGTAVQSSIPPKPPVCQSGWMLVYAESVHRVSIPKCAAVGDLRDPE